MRENRFEGSPSKLVLDWRGVPSLNGPTLAGE